MLSLMPWLDRLNALDGGPAVTLAADAEAAQNNARLPSMMLVPGRDTVSHAGMSDHARHRVKTEVLLITGIRRNNQVLGPVAAQGGDALARLRKPALEQLINWLPPGCDIPVKWQRGQLLALPSHALFWADVLTAEYWWPGADA